MEWPSYSFQPFLQEVYLRLLHMPRHREDGLCVVVQCCTAEIIIYESAQSGSTIKPRWINGRCGFRVGGSLARNLILPSINVHFSSKLKDIDRITRGSST
ncbi:hypothetical protein AVEN_171758-1 [Araneus ventricosus]|uniref:Uncharacterized protein n=1 Tax=Araneus ventricosus TaxID=182803 RepID=A0A4Y2CTM0_ARAVE|nr:hypothetical protein AVEN_104238-1 [Araneus ventricosus]GBM07557.1 hypothetical protein AVEN_171758-1 [Araneus ventricosus]